MSAYFENRNSKIYISYNEKSYNYDSHFHSKTEIAYCFSGFQDVKVGNTVYTLQKGDAVIIFPNVVHEYICYIIYKSCHWPIHVCSVNKIIT